MSRCDDCDREFKNAAGLAAHNRTKHPAPVVVTDVTAPVAPAPVVPAGPAFLDSPRRAGINVSTPGRSVKMLRPICATCQRGKDIPRDWYTRCTHNPYVGRRRNEEKVPIYETLPDGRSKVLGEDTIHSWAPSPNLVGIAARPRIDSDKRVLRKRAMGFIFPEELRSPEFPAGIAPICQYRNCTWQEGLIETRWGVYCREVEAQLIGQDLRPGALEVGGRAENKEKQMAQLEGVPL